MIVSHDGAIELRDQLQAQVVERLRAARGAPVAFDELRAMGIENPALLGYELAAAGLPIEQTRDSAGRALTLDSRARAEHPNGERPDLGPAGGAEGPAPRDASAGGLGARLSPLRPGFTVRRPSRAVAAAGAALTIARRRPTVAGRVTRRRSLARGDRA